ncbi:MAG: hypothetical protein M3374_06885 [Pseudomonadota bacterium]|nr:hypothetical protein [Pseudomonadota bacterium]
MAWLKVAALVLLFVPCGVLYAQGKVATQSHISLQGFQAQRLLIESEFRQGGRYGEILRADISAVKAAFDRMEVLLARADSVDQLPDDNRVELFNLQEKANTILTQASKDSRLVCRNETPVGSRMRKGICKTVAERRLAREEALEGFSRGSHSGQIQLPQVDGGP